MTWTNIPDGNLSPGQPITFPLMNELNDNLEGLFNQDLGAPTIDIKRVKSPSACPGMLMNISDVTADRVDGYFFDQFIHLLKVTNMTATLSGGATNVALTGGVSTTVRNMAYNSLTGVFETTNPGTRTRWETSLNCILFGKVTTNIAAGNDRVNPVIQRATNAGHNPPENLGARGYRLLNPRPATKMFFYETIVDANSSTNGTNSDRINFEIDSDNFPANADFSIDVTMYAWS